MPVCPSCGIGYMDGEPHVCGKAGSVEVRYINAYRVATTIVLLGIVVQIAGAGAAVLALVVSLGGVALVGSLALGALGSVTGIVVGIVLALIGMFVRAQGELLRASLDTAVNSSPFLTRDQKARAMGVT
jgi:hypothetical protein